MDDFNVRRKIWREQQLREAEAYWKGLWVGSGVALLIVALGAAVITWFAR